MTTTAAFAQVGTGIQINEVMANNVSVANGGIISDWVELYNPSANSVDLTGATLSDSSANQFVFPAGSMIAAQSFLVIRFNPAAPFSATNTGFGLKNEGDRVSLSARLSEGGVLLSEIQFGIQTANFTIGQVPDGSGLWTLTTPTYRAANTAATLGSIFTLKINEWMIEPSGCNNCDWFELYNPDPLPVSLGGLHFTDDLFNPVKHTIPALSFIGSGAANGFIQFEQKSSPGTDADYFTFGIRVGETLALYWPGDLVTPIDAIGMGPQVQGVSEGRLPDGSSGPYISFAETPTPGKPNELLYALTNVVINELLAHVDPPLEDAVELHNVTDAPIDIGGWYLTDQQNDPRKFRIPPGTIIAARGFKVYYEYQFNAKTAVKRFNFNSAHGGNIFLFQADATDKLLAFNSQSFGASLNGVSFGRFVKSDGEDFVAMPRLTLGTSVTASSPPSQTNLFRTGKGAANPYPLIGPVIINEIMYHPPDIGTNDNTLDEYVELRNVTPSPVPLYDTLYPTNRWRLRLQGGGVDFVFPKNYVMPANAYILVLKFNPTNAGLVAAFRAKYGVPNTVRLFGPYSGELNNSGETVELERPDHVQTRPPDAGFVPYVLVDKVKYRDAAPWPEGTDGTGKSLQRKWNKLYGDDPANWRGDNPTPGGINGFPPVITDPPDSQFVYAGATVTLTTLASGTEPLAYQWRFNDFEIAGATNNTLTVANFGAAKAGRYTVIVGNFVSTIVSPVARLSGDFINPIVTITNPVNNARVTSEILRVKGRGIDAGGVTNVQVLVNELDFVAATGTAHWWADVTLVPGTNVIQAFARDVGLNSSLPATIKVFYAVPTPLTLNVTAGGTVTGVTNGQLLDYSGTYTAVARPAPGYLFAGWTGDITSSNPILRFVMQYDMELTANFILNPFTPVKGSYNGLFFVTDAVTPTNAGFFRLTLNDTGLFSGNLILGRVTNKFAGQFEVNSLRSQVRIPRTGRTPLDLDLTLTSVGEVVGTITDGAWTAGVESFRTGAFPELVPFAGRYPWLIPGAEDSSSSPGGDGAGTAVAATNGVVKFTGTLGDGTAVSHTANLSRQGDYPLHVVLHNGQGILLGWINFYTNIVMSNSLTWIRPPIPAAKFYPAGFGGDTLFYGSKYVKPPAGQNALKWSNGVVLIGAGNLNAPISNRVQVLNNVVTVLDGNTNRIKLAISVTNGTFSGSFRNPDTRKTNTFTGSLLQLAHLGGGRFTGTNQTGFVSLEPVPPAVSIISPTNGLIIDTCSNLIITADATVTSGQNIARVEFYLDGLPIGSDEAAPYEWVYVPIATGPHWFVVVAVDNLGGRSELAAVQVHLRNHAPSFTAGTNVVVELDSGAFVGSWATDISDGESCFDQPFSFLVNNDNEGLFSVQPAIDVNGNLSFTPAPGMSGTALVTVVLADQSGTDNGGVNVSQPTLFTITVNPAPPPPPPSN